MKWTAVKGSNYVKTIKKLLIKLHLTCKISTTKLFAGDVPVSFILPNPVICKQIRNFIYDDSIVTL